MISYMFAHFSRKLYVLGAQLLNHVFMFLKGGFSLYIDYALLKEHTVYILGISEKLKALYLILYQHKSKIE